MLIHAKLFRSTSSTMNPSRFLLTKPAKTPHFLVKTPYIKRLSGLMARGTSFLPTTTHCSRADVHLAVGATRSSSSLSSSARALGAKLERLEAVEADIEKVIYRCRFLAILGVFGSLVGSFLCFIKGCAYVGSSFMEYFFSRGKVIILLVEAIDIYLLGTVMLVFGMGLYELFVSNLDTSKLSSEERIQHRSNLFGLFTLKERPKWLEIKSVNELKTKLGHVIVMLLLIGFFEKSKTAAIHSPIDLLCFSASVLLCSGCLYLLSRLTDSEYHTASSNG